MSPGLHAPAEQGGVLFDPSPEHVVELLDRAKSFDLPYFQFLDLSFKEWRDLARKSARLISSQCHAAVGESFKDIPSANSAGPWIMAGHQPGLAHPGVWLKNFVLAELAARHSAFSLNLIVDNDTLKNRSIKVPVWPGPHSPCASVRAQTVPFDEGVAEVPFEEATVREQQTFREFAEHVSELTKDWPEQPIATDFWREVLSVNSPLIGERIATARRAFEVRMGHSNPEISVSRSCCSWAFGMYMAAILLDLPRFHAIHNRSVHAFRKAHGVRSRNHPVPDLASDSEWYEAPFWIWRRGSNQRMRLFVKPSKDHVELFMDSDPVGTLSAKRFGEEWMVLQKSGIKIRPRALTLTLFARLALADLFIHGIGGGIYDQLTDEISRQFFGAAPPPYMVVTGTLRLPLTIDPPLTKVAPLRDLQWKPQRYAVATDGAAELVAERQRLIANVPMTRRGRRERYHALRENRERLLPFVTQPLTEARKAEADAAARARANAILGSREYSFVLHSERALREFFENAVSRITS
ncbi:MAG: hypothetical protein ACJ8C4_13765 [Gemmataceae bacterium]